jgi:hypothetical protein
MLLLAQLSGLACMQTFTAAWMAGEVHSLARDWEQRSEEQKAGLAAVLVANGVVAFGLNFVSFLTNRRVGALSIAVASNVKQSMIILLSVWIFGYVISGVNGMGEFVYEF